MATPPPPPVSSIHGAQAFVFEIDGKICVASTVLEYDPNAPNLTRQQIEGVAQVKAMFEAARKTRSIEATVLTFDEFVAFLNTGPRPR